MSHIAQFDHPKEYTMILRDSYHEDMYYGLDDFDCKVLKIIQAKFGCQNSFHTIPDRVQMEMAPFEWSEKRQMFVLDDNKRRNIQLNQLENMIIRHTAQKV